MRGPSRHQALEFVGWMAWGFVVGVAVASAMFFLFGCGPTCKTGDQTCKGNMVFTCSPDGWRKTLDCSILAPGRWTCKGDGRRGECKPKKSR